MTQPSAQSGQTQPASPDTEAEKIVNSNAGWSHLTNALGKTMPNQLVHAHRAIDGLHRLQKKRR